MERWDPKKLEIRLMKQADLDAVTDIDESVFGRSAPWSITNPKSSPPWIPKERL